jgi:hypothetical protein
MAQPYPPHLPVGRGHRPAFLTEGLLSAALSAAMLMWRGRADNHSAAAPLNAVSHLVWPQAALRSDEASWRHTGTGAALHTASSLLWGSLYAWLRHRRLRPGALDAVTDAAAVSAVAAWVDFKLMPPRLTPGFEHRLSGRSLAWVYVALAAGLALGGLKALRDERGAG